MRQGGKTSSCSTLFLASLPAPTPPPRGPPSTQTTTAVLESKKARTNSFFNKAGGKINESKLLLLLFLCMVCLEDEVQSLLCQASRRGLLPNLLNREIVRYTDQGSQASR